MERRNQKKRKKKKSAAPGGIRTLDLQITRRVLYLYVKTVAQVQGHLR